MSHEIGLAVWDLPSPVVAGRHAKLKVGISCSCGCDLAGTHIYVCDDSGAQVGSGTLGAAPWLSTSALYWAELDLTPPEREGDHSWSIHAVGLEPIHAHATSVVRFAASRPPEHRVVVETIDRASGLPIGGVDLRLSRFRTATNDDGVAHLEVPGGSYDVGTWKIGYEIVSKTIQIAEDTTIRLELTAAPEAEQPYWM